ncbi:antibiotic biosynthesis monooxygenase [Acidisoma cellulosilytica]|uniref:Antibiotic biosynthesis monooxygenase n=1 Tax=Acidisoma cellulosilyticum TaxID=2802395 RepID=A0A963Z859_9PROT|nr:antibiotic biosynthesis monooxygenase [Acidisoma cellulosilyticum]MCB8883632.1 antibiotic biosynthesis monooxygenase [Acidisoma cellulosilyticum]
MITITAIIRVRAGAADAMLDALAEVADYVRSEEPTTVGFFVSRDLETPCIFTTYERFIDRAAMDLHNSSETVARFFAKATPLLEGPVVLHSCEELIAVARQETNSR